MADKEDHEDHTNTEPGKPRSQNNDSEITITQVQWAWLMSSAPWLIVTGAFVAFPQIGIEEWVATFIILVVVIPRYFMWRGTSYTLGEEHLIYRRGGIMSSKEYPLPYGRMTTVKSRFGMFGRAFGYQAVDVMLNNGAVATLSYIPILANTEERITKKIENAEPIEDTESQETDSD